MKFFRMLTACLLILGPFASAQGPAAKKVEPKNVRAPATAESKPSTLSNFEIMQLASDADPNRGRRTAFALYLLSAAYGEKSDRDGCETRESVKASCEAIEGMPDSQLCKIEILSTCKTEGANSSEWITFRIKKSEAEEGEEWTADTKSTVRGET